MKINEVEHRVGITKKNIRFYEEKQLIHPARLAENGYRDYGEEDVEELFKIKLLRKLAVPIDEIRLLQEGKITFSECMERQQRSLQQEQRRLEVIWNMCTELQEREESIARLSAQEYLERMEHMEKGGVQFMNIQEEDRRKQKIGPWIAAGVMVLFMAATMGLLLWAQSVDPLPIGLFLFVLAVPIIVIVGVLLALYMRLKEIEGGEANEAAKY